MTFWLWSKTASSNATADSTVNYRENQAPSTLNDSGRAAMAATAKFRDDITGALLTTGSSSAYALTTNQNYNPSAGNTLTDGLTVSFRPHATNAAGATLNVDASANFPLRTLTGTAIPAGSLIAGTPYRAYYNLANNEWLVFGAFGNPYNIPIGGFLDYVSDTPPNSNFVLPYGQAISRTTYATLFALIGTTFGAGDGTTTFNVPDLRGRIVVGEDDMGGVAANRVTNAVSGIDGTAIGAVGGAQSVTLARSALPNVQLAFTGNAVPDHTHGVTIPGNTSTGGGAGMSHTGTAGFNYNYNTDAAGGHTPSGTIESMNGNVAQTAVNKMPPCIVLPKLLRVI